LEIEQIINNNNKYLRIFFAHFFAASAIPDTFANVQHLSLASSRLKIEQIINNNNKYLRIFFAHFFILHRQSRHICLCAAHSPTLSQVENRANYQQQQKIFANIFFTLFAASAIPTHLPMCDTFTYCE
jgi:hypothetical protein